MRRSWRCSVAMVVALVTFGLLAGPLPPPPVQAQTAAAVPTPPARGSIYLSIMLAGVLLLGGCGGRARASSSAGREEPAFSGCVPTDVRLDEIIETASSSGGQPPARKVTVEQKLTDLIARCRDGKLADASGREIRFYRLIGCWGNPPRNYQAMLQRQQEEIAKLRERYTVVEMTCNPAGAPIQ